jgi:hypothetical protein
MKQFNQLLIFQNVIIFNEVHLEMLILLIIIFSVIEILCMLEFFLIYFITFRFFIRLLHPPFMSPFSRGDVTRVTSSKFQPFNPRYRPSNLNESRNMTPSIPNSNDPANTRLSRPSN